MTLATAASGDGGVVDAPVLSDEEMLASEYVPATPADAETPAAEVTTPAVETPDAEEVPAAVVVPEKEETPPAEVNPLSDDELLKAGKPAAVEPVKKEDKPAVKESEVDPATAVEEAKPLDYKAFHDEVMKPFKANGKTIELRTPEEAVQLMKMGANYTRKMQDFAPFRKMATMLENNQIDEDRLSYLIDLDKKNPDAVKKLVKDSGIDPLDIDTSNPVEYQAGNHKVSDDEMKFRNVLDAVRATPEGQETLQLLNTAWDQASKDVLWTSPEVMEVIHEQRQSGVYQQVADEIDRQRALGNIAPSTPFIEAYKTVGNFMGERGMLKGLPNEQPTQKPPAPVAPVATKVAAPKPMVTNQQQVAAAAVTRPSGKRAPVVANLAGLDDSAFLQTFAGRL